MTLVLLGPATVDKIVVGSNQEYKVGGASYFQSYVFESFDVDYIAAVNLENLKLIQSFPDKDKVIPLIKKDTHFFINDYPDPDNLDLRKQYSNFPDIPISVEDIREILERVDRIDAFILNPLNQNDFPLETVRFLKTLGCPVYMSVQGFLRVPDLENEEEGNFPILLQKPDFLDEILSYADGLFLDEREAGIVFENSKVDIRETVVTDASSGSRVILGDEGMEYRIEAVKPEVFRDSTGCGDTYMAAYITKRIESKSPREAGEFASLIASRKIEVTGPYKEQL